MAARALLLAFPALASAESAWPSPTRDDPDWLDAYQSGSLLYSQNLTALFPYVGNGFLATHPVHIPSLIPAHGDTAAMNEDSTVLYVSGLFNGVAVASPPDGNWTRFPGRATIPTYTVAAGVNKTSSRYALDLARAVLMRRATISTVVVEDRWYAHLRRRNLLVHQITLYNHGSAPVHVNLSAANGTGTSPDIDFHQVELIRGMDRSSWLNSSTNGVRAIVGRVAHAEMPFLRRPTVALVSNVPPREVVLAPQETKTLVYVMAVATSLDSASPVVAATAALSSAMQASATALLAEHEVAWESRWAQGHVEIVGDLHLAQVINSSMYYLLSSVRDDWPQGLSPGGLGACLASRSSTQQLF